MRWTSNFVRGRAVALGAKPMSLHHYVANKGEILDGIVDLVFSQIELPSAEGAWRSEMHRRASSVREGLSRHTWATGLLESGPPPVLQPCATTMRPSAHCAGRAFPCS
jgi:hypothetical protein